MKKLNLLIFGVEEDCAHRLGSTVKHHLACDSPQWSLDYDYADTLDRALVLLAVRGAHLVSIWDKTPDFSGDRLLLTVATLADAIAEHPSQPWVTYWPKLHLDEFFLAKRITIKTGMIPRILVERIRGPASLAA